MIRMNLEYQLLKSIEYMSRREAVASNNPNSPWPDCVFLLHQPKRPKQSR